MKKIIIIISILLIFPSILFAADWPWLLWEYWRNPLKMEDTGSWSLVNALNSRNECLDAVLKEHIEFYKRYLDDSTSEVLPKPDETELQCIQSSPMSDACKRLLTYFVMGLSDREGIKSKLRWDSYESKEARQAYEKVMQMRKEGKTSEEIKEFYKASGIEKVFTSSSRVQYWCLPVGVDPKTIGNKY